MRKRLLIPALALVANVQAQPETIMQATTSWDGGAIAYPDGQAEVTSVMLNIKEGQEPPFHCHPVPTMGYLLKGKVRVDTADGKSIEINEGEPLVEVMNTVHRGVALGGDAQIVVFYAGAEGVPVTVMPDDDPDGHCKS